MVSPNTRGKWFINVPARLAWSWPSWIDSTRRVGSPQADASYGIIPAPGLLTAVMGAIGATTDDAVINQATLRLPHAFLLSMMSRASAIPDAGRSTRLATAHVARTYDVS